MAFCTNCGGNFAEGARFCTRCGSPQAGGAPAGTAAPSSSFLPPLPQQTFAPSYALDYTIQGNNLQIARLHLKADQEVYGEAGRMVYKTGNVYWDTRMTGSTLGDKLLGALRRKLTGESLFFTYFRVERTGRGGFRRCVSRQGRAVHSRRRSIHRCPARYVSLCADQRHFRYRLCSAVRGPGCSAEKDSSSKNSRAQESFSCMPWGDVVEFNLAPRRVDPNRLGMHRGLRRIGYL